MRLLLTRLAIAGLANPAAACINDVELPSHEREFRSQYRGPSNPSLLLAAGAALLTGATALALTVTGRRTRG